LAQGVGGSKDMKENNKEKVLKSESEEIQYSIYLGDDVEMFKVAALVKKSIVGRAHSKFFSVENLET